MDDYKILEGEITSEEVLELSQESASYNCRNRRNPDKIKIIIRVVPGSTEHGYINNNYVLTENESPAHAHILVPNNSKLLKGSKVLDKSKEIIIGFLNITGPEPTSINDINQCFIDRSETKLIFDKEVKGNILYAVNSTFIENDPDFPKNIYTVWDYMQRKWAKEMPNYIISDEKLLKQRRNRRNNNNIGSVNKNKKA
jgi:hypothetical protein